jgi:5-methylcytosine-specific restriction endonuclease McrA
MAWRAPVAGAAEAKQRSEDERRWRDKLRREHDKYRHLYGLKSWKMLRISKLNESPMCEAKEKDGYPCRNGAYVVHHVKDHKGDPALFFDRENLQSLCKSHHDQETARRVNADREKADGL